MPGKEDQVNNIPRKEQKVVGINVLRANELINNFSSREVIRRKSAVQRKILKSIMKNRSNIQSFFFIYFNICNKNIVSYKNNEDIKNFQFQTEHIQNFNYTKILDNKNIKNFSFHKRNIITLHKSQKI